MATPNDWAHAYLQQASADLRASLECGVPSARALPLQMVLEKVAKAALLRGGRMTVAKARATHVAAAEMVRVLDGRAFKRLHWSHDAVRNRIVPIVHELEKAQPKEARGGPGLEYPWLDPAFVVKWPEAHLPPAGEKVPPAKRRRDLVDELRRGSAQEVRSGVRVGSRGAGIC